MDCQFSSRCSSAQFVPFSIKQETNLPRKFIFFPRKFHFPSWVSQISVKNCVRDHLKIKSSNGQPLNAVSLPDGISGSSLLNEQIALQEKDGSFLDLDKVQSTLSITIVGASGDLAKKKIFPALFALYYEGCLPENFIVFGYARTKMTDEELRNMISKTLTCRIDKRENCEDKMDEFLKRCFYHSGQYNSEEHFAELDSKLKEKESHWFTGTGMEASKLS